MVKSYPSVEFSNRLNTYDKILFLYPKLRFFEIPNGESYKYEILYVKGLIGFLEIIFTTPPIALDPYKLDIPPSTISILSTLEISNISKSNIPENSPETLAPSIRNNIFLSLKP